MRTFQSLVVASGIVMTAAVVASARPQEPRSQPQSPAASATVEGCLYKEVDVPGRHVPDAMRSSSTRLVAVTTRTLMVPVRRSDPTR